MIMKLISGGGFGGPYYTQRDGKWVSVEPQNVRMSMSAGNRKFLIIIKIQEL